MMAALPPRKNSTPTKLTRQSLTPLQVLLQMGFPKHRAEKALAATGHRGVQLGSDWLLAHVNDPTLDDHLPREYILYACPTGPLLEHLEQFWFKSKQECVYNGAHTYMPHVTLVSFFKAPDESVTSLSTCLQQVVDRNLAHCPDRIGLEPYISQNFMGFFLAGDHADFFKKIAFQFVKEVSDASKIRLLYVISSHPHANCELQKLNTVVSDGQEYYEGALAACFPWCSYVNAKLSLPRKRCKILPLARFLSCVLGEAAIIPEAHNQELHLTLAYQFPTSQFGPLESLVKQIDVDAAAQWEVRLYSRDARIGGHDVFKVLFPHVSREQDELELLMGDYVFIAPESIKSSVDGWVEATSWLTGCTGYIPCNYVERTAESDAWTLHKGIVLSRPQRLAPDCIDRKTGADLALPDPAHLENPKECSELPPPIRRSNLVKPVTPKMFSAQPAFFPNVTLPGPRQLFIVRHGERVDFTFGSWIPYCFDETGKYIRKDLNMPLQVPQRINSPDSFFKDCPLTCMGELQARLTGEGMKRANLTLHHVYCSPALRCVQTCHNILLGLGLEKQVSICIEPGLFEWLAWYQDVMPQWMSLEDLHQAGFNICFGYKPFIAVTELDNSRESSEQYYMRSFYISQSVLKSTASLGGNVLLVGHASTVDACSRQLVGGGPRSAHDLSRIVHKVPYCSMAMVQQCQNVEECQESNGEETTKDPWTQWKLIEPPFAPLTHTANARFEWQTLLT